LTRVGSISGVASEWARPGVALGGVITHGRFTSIKITKAIQIVMKINKTVKVRSYERQIAER